MKYFLAVTVLALPAVLFNLSACSSGGDDDSGGGDDTGGGTCGVDQFTEKFNACTGENRTPEEVTQQYDNVCVSTDEMIQCACEAFRDNDCTAAQSLLGECFTQHCTPQ